jgi:two-component system OmpR family sensor kinase
MAHWVPAGPRRGIPWIAAGVALAIAILVSALNDVAALVHPLAGPSVRTAIAVAWLLAAIGPLLGGLRAHDRTMWRVGLGLAVMAAAQLHDAVARTGLAEGSLVATALQFVGAVGVLSAALRNLRGEVTGLLGEREQQRAELREAAERVERAAVLARERDHELANGLAGLAGIAYLLGQPVEHSGSDGAALRSAVLAELGRLHTLLAQSAQPPGGTVRPGGCFDLGAALGELVALHRAAGHPIELVANGSLPVRGDRDAVAQVLTNLLVNCARHAPGSRVRVQARHESDHLRDEGIIGAATGGSGLGLFVSRRLVVEQGGDLHVLPTAGRGFRVGFTLPVARTTTRPGALPVEEEQVSR